jgi:hypothetical protein
MRSLLSSSILSTIIEAILRIIVGHPTTIRDFFFDVFQRFPHFKSLSGMYEVLSYHTELELMDRGGKKAIYHKKQRVRFLQDNVIAYYDTAWGDGNIFADYKCSPGVKVDSFREDYRYNILISLRKTKHRGDKSTMSVERTILDGFTKSDELFQTDINHRTRFLSISVVFPKSRPPFQIDLVQKNKNKVIEFKSQHKQVLMDGRIQYTWKTKTPALFESYIVRWSW